MEELKIMETMEPGTMDTYEPEVEEAGKGGIPVAVVGAAVVGIGLGIAAVKKGKGKLTEWNIKRLKKKGYVVNKPEDIVEEASEEKTEKEE